ncbi:hypothetical protein, partial [Klebsiella grimontii]|uniref:hypothetical protein n=1 Tax=Klebsiella grimontii TaxID=2058152 RepID=UPI0039FD2A61
ASRLSGLPELPPSGAEPEIPGRGVNVLPGRRLRRRLETRSPGKRSATGENGAVYCRVMKHSPEAARRACPGYPNCLPQAPSRKSRVAA